MVYGQVPHVAKKVSRLAIGTMLEGASGEAEGHALFDEFFAQGGNAFDTAYVYGGGQGEKIFGNWLAARGVRDEVFILGKGAHPPNCTPEGAAQELDESLARMNVQAVDLYMPHRDNLDVPIADWVEWFNAALQAGKFSAYGGSNWTAERVEEVNAYAAQKGLQGFSAISNNLSLARMVNPVWDGCLSLNNAASRAWLQEQQLPVFSWSSQARGFFVRGDRDFTEDAELVRCWYSDDNFERLERVRALAAERGTSPINIALAWVIGQKFPTFALVGPRNSTEIRSCVEGLSVELSDEEMKHLNLEA
jgi:aryl-alcohol dehydrogenase-like predicted oxidoreductase